MGPQTHTLSLSLWSRTGLQDKPESLPGGFAGHGLPHRDGPLDDFAPVEFLVEMHEGEAEDGGGDDGDEGGDAIDAHGHDWGSSIRKLIKPQKEMENQKGGNVR